MSGFRHWVSDSRLDGVPPSVTAAGDEPEGSSAQSSRNVLCSRNAMRFPKYLFVSFDAVVSCVFVSKGCNPLAAPRCELEFDVQQLFHSLTTLRCEQSYFERVPARAISSRTVSVSRVTAIVSNFNFNGTRQFPFRFRGSQRQIWA
jgi:hypothetical protein